MRRLGGMGVRRGARGGGGEEFSPASLAGLYVWHRGDVVTLVSGDVSSWTDLSGNARHSTQGTAANRPTWLASEAKFGGRPALRFVADGVEQNWLACVDLTSLTAGEIFCALAVEAYPAPTTGRSGLWQFGTPTSSSYYAWASGGGIFDAFGTSVRKDTGAGEPGTANALVYSVHSAPSDWASKKNGAALVSSGTNTVAFRAAPMIGRANDAWLDGRMAELILYSRKLTTPERNAVLTYLGGRYAIAVTLS